MISNKGWGIMVNVARFKTRLQKLELYIAGLKEHRILLQIIEAEESDEWKKKTFMT